MSRDAGALEIDPRVALREVLHARNLIGDRVIAAHRAVVGVLERFRSAGRAPAIDGDDDEAEFGEGLPIAARRRERSVAGAAGLRPRVDVVDDRVLLRWVEI